MKRDTGVTVKLHTAVIAVLLVGSGSAAGWWWLGRDPAATSFRTVQVERADVRATVSATGALEAVVTVEVGTQVSGVLDEVLVDFNDQVTEGQVLARIDTSLLEADVASAAANLAVREAERVQAASDLARTEGLQQRGAATSTEVEEARTDLAVARAQARAATVSLRRARQNLGYATIASPIDGTVVERAVDQGQTVNAGMSAPKLFLLAGDLERLQIVANVDEADIGRIAAEQAVRFTVQAWDRQDFTGRVRQVRLQSTTEENVVTYAVVVDVDNPDGKLLPGMTATVDFVVAEARDVLCVPNAALRFRPEADQLAPGVEPPGDGSGRGRSGGGQGRLWREAEAGGVVPLAVQTGLSDGSCTEVSGDGVVEGLAVVAGVQHGGTEAAAGGNPFRQQSSSRRGPGGF